MYYIYVLKNENEIVYVGRTQNIKRRMYQHKSEGSKKYDSYEVLRELEKLTSACTIEDRMIKKHLPKYNRATNEHGYFIHFDEIKSHFNLDEDEMDKHLDKIRIRPIFDNYYKHITIRKVEELLENGKR